MDKNLRTLLTICSVFGIYLQNRNYCGHNGRHIFSVYIILLMTILFLNCVLGIMTTQIINEFIISWVVSTIVFISQMLTHFFIMYEALTKHKAHTDFLRLLQDIVVYFKIFLKIDVKKSTIVEELRLNFIILTSISMIGLIVFALNFLFDYDAGYFWWALPAILAIRFRFIQLIIYVKILKFYILSLNKKLNQVVSLKTENSKQLLDIDYRHLQSIEVMKNIRKIYSSIYEASTYMNEFAQVSLFAASASQCLDFTCHIYWTLLTMDKLLPFNSTISSVATVLPLALFTIQFCCSCQVIKEEGDRTTLLLSRLLCSGTYPLVNKTYKNLLHDFSLQLMHQRIEFSGNRFFTFDLNFIFAICALIATHLIILIQFTQNDSSHYLNKTSAETE